MRARGAQDLGTVPSKNTPFDRPMAPIRLEVVARRRSGRSCHTRLAAFPHRQRQQWPSDRSRRVTSHLRSVHTYPYLPRRIAFLLLGPAASITYMTSSCSTYSYSCPIQISAWLSRSTTTGHDCPSTTRYIVHSSRELFPFFFCAVALNNSGCVLVAVEEPLLARVWQAPLAGF